MPLFIRSSNRKLTSKIVVPIDDQLLLQILGACDKLSSQLVFKALYSFICFHLRLL